VPAIALSDGTVTGEVIVLQIFFMLLQISAEGDSMPQSR